MNNETKKQGNTSPKDFFLHLLMIVTLYGSIISLLMIIFQSINIALPDLLEQYRYTGSLRTLRSGIAGAIIMFPAYLAVMWGLGKSYLKDPEKLHLGIRRWLIYFTLFVGSVIAIVDLIIVLNSFLNGEISLRFILKAISVFIVVGIPLFYYTLDIRKEPNIKATKLLKIGSIIVATVLIIIGFIYSGSPGQARQEGFDEQRVRNLENIYWSIESYTEQNDNKTLPQTLDILNPQFLTPIPTDPETKEQYRYEIINKEQYRLCATFSQPSRQEPQINEWNHPAGEHCFEKSIKNIEGQRTPKLLPEPTF